MQIVSRLFIVYCFRNATSIPSESERFERFDSFRRPQTTLNSLLLLFLVLPRAVFVSPCVLRSDCGETAPNRSALINRLVQIICKLAVFPFCFYYKIDDVNKNILIPVRFSWDVRHTPAAKLCHHQWNKRAGRRSDGRAPSQHRHSPLTANLTASRSSHGTAYKMCENKNTAAGARRHSALQLQLWDDFFSSLVNCMYYFPRVTVFWSLFPTFSTLSVHKTNNLQLKLPPSRNDAATSKQFGFFFCKFASYRMYMSIESAAGFA